MEVIKNKRILALVGIIGLILGSFLPYYKISFLGISKTIALWGYLEGKVIFILTLANALFIFQDYIEKYVPQLFNNWVGNIVQKAKNPKLSIVPTILAALFVISLIIRIDIDTNYVKYGLGFWVLWIGIISLIGHSIFYKKEEVQTVEQSQQPINYQQVEPQIDPTKKVCPQCRTQVDLNTDTCFMCGNKF